MKFKSSLFSQSSGSLGGTTFSRNRFGSYVRERAVPVDPGTPDQVILRNRLAGTATKWVNTLTAEQRLGWEMYASQVPLVDKLGEPIFVTGLNMFVRSNVFRSYIGLAQVETAPAVFTQASMTMPSFITDAAADEVELAFTNTDTWATAVGGALAVFASRPQNPTINFFKGPFSLAGTVLGAVVPPTSPVTIALPFPAVVGQRVFYRVRVVNADARLSPFVIDFDDAS